MYKAKDFPVEIVMQCISIGDAESSMNARCPYLHGAVGSRKWS